MVTIYTDGACSGNPGPGGWAALLEYKGTRKTFSGAKANTTNNQMELQAAIEGLKVLNRSCKVTVITDSHYVKNGITIWLPKWRAKNWRTADGKPVKNLELWHELDSLVKKHTVEWQWVKGHSGDEGNDIVDQLARDAIVKLRKANKE